MLSCEGRLASLEIAVVCRSWFASRIGNQLVTLHRDFLMRERCFRRMGKSCCVNSASNIKDVSNFDGVIPLRRCHRQRWCRVRTILGLFLFLEPLLELLLELLLDLLELLCRFTLKLILDLILDLWKQELVINRNYNIYRSDLPLTIITGSLCPCESHKWAIAFSSCTVKEPIKPGSVVGGSKKA